MVFEYIQERFRSAYKYFACPQRRPGGGALRGHPLGKQGRKVEDLDGETPVRNREDEGKDDRSRRLAGLTEDESDDEDGGEKTLDSSLKDLALRDQGKPPPSPNGLLDSAEEMGGATRQDVPSDHLHYVFDKMIFTGGKVNATTSLTLCEYVTFRTQTRPPHWGASGLAQDVHDYRMILMIEKLEHGFSLQRWCAASASVTAT